MKQALFSLAVVAFLCGVIGAALAAKLPPGGSFTDDGGNIHEPSIEAIAAEGITRGCNPPANTLYCPTDTVTRGQMAAFLNRALDLPATGVDFFGDDDASIFEGDINRLAASGITKGCNPPVNDHVCPEGNVTRGQMAAFLVRAFGYKDNGGGDLFVDDDTSIFEGDIDRLGAAGVTKGCDPPANDRFCPDDPVLRDQMASFLARALRMAPIYPPPPVVPQFALAWGSSGSDPDQLEYPLGIDVSTDGTVYVADSANRRLQVFSPTGALVDSWPGYYVGPRDVAVAQDGSVYVDCGQKDPWKREICHLSPDGKVIDSFGTEYAPSPGYMNLDVAPDGSVFALAFRYLSQVVHFTADGEFIAWWGNLGPTEENFRATGLAVSSEGTVYVTSYARDIAFGVREFEARVLRFKPDGTYIDSFHLREAPWLTEPLTAREIAIGPDDSVYVADSAGRIQRFTADGEFLGSWGSLGFGEGEFSGPIAVTAGAKTVYTVERDLGRVQKFIYP
ncbi:MAG: hypothetical protein U9N79_10140 [Actinomycetota bacterium]|nr:hypothetical protein [Actinomycetota bacterium]